MICMFLHAGKTFSQAGDMEALRQQAAEYMQYEEYHAAVGVLRELIRFEPDNASFNFWYAKSLYNTYKKKGCLQYFERTGKLDPEVDREFHHYYALALHYNHFFKEAIAEYQMDLKYHRINSEPFEYVLNRIAQCDYGNRMLKNRTPDSERIIISNLGAKINSEFSEHSPVISENDSILLYTARRPECLGADVESHFYDEDVYKAYKREEKWTLGENIGKPVNSKGHDATIALTDDGMTLFIYRHLRDGGFFVTDFDTLGNAWKEPRAMEKPFNSKFYEACVFLSPDGKKLYFSSNRPGGYGGKDLYSSDIDSSGDWGEPRNLGPVVNGPFDEDSPFMHPDGKRLYFSSNGPNSIGGFDLFLTEVNEKEEFIEPINLGYPVNDADDDIYFVLNKEGNTGYYASGKEGGFGEKDIYSIEFPYYPYPRRQNIIVLEGVVLEDLTGDTLEARIRLLDKTTGVYQEMIVNRIDPKMFHFELASEGDYTIEVVSDGYDSYSESLLSPKLMGKDIYIERTIRLRKPSDPLVREEIELMNIYYDFDKWDLRDESRAELDRVIALLRKDRNLELEIRGHTDWYNTVRYNQDLSENRCGEAYKYLLLQGIDRERIRLTGLSENRPLDPNTDDTGRQFNRRSEFHFYREGEFAFKSGRLRTGITDVRVDHAPPKGKPGFDEPGSVVLLYDDSQGSQPYSIHASSNRADNEGRRIPDEFVTPWAEFLHFRR